MNIHSTCYENYVPELKWLLGLSLGIRIFNQTVRSASFGPKNSEMKKLWRWLWAKRHHWQNCCPGGSYLFMKFEVFIQNPDFFQGMECIIFNNSSYNTQKYIRHKYAHMNLTPKKKNNKRGKKSKRKTKKTCLITTIDWYKKYYSPLTCGTVNLWTPLGPFTLTLHLTACTGVVLVLNVPSKMTQSLETSRREPLSSRDWDLGLDFVIRLILARPLYNIK